jgi:NADPH:quinone reductase
VKALVLHGFGGTEALTIQECVAPKPAAGEVLIDVHFASINFADLLVIAGKYQKLPTLPFIPGRESAGVVRKVGADAALKPGDRVMVHVEQGAFAQQLLATAQQCFVLQNSIELRLAAALGQSYITAHFALFERAQLRSGETVLVTGAAGGVGLAAVQLAKASGATVLAAVSGPEKASIVLANGADYVIDVGVSDLKNGLRDQVFAAIGNRGADVIFDTVGGDVFHAAVRAIAWCGRVLVIGFTSGRIPEIRAGLILVKNISIVGMQINDYRERVPEKVRLVQKELIDMFEAGRIRPLVSRTFPLDEYADAFMLARDRKTIGKVMLEPIR